MSYVVYNRHTTRLLCKHPGTKTDRETFPDQKQAKAALTRELRNMAAYVERQTSTRLKSQYTVYERDDFRIETTDAFTKVLEQTETKRNLITGQEFTQSVNTPRCCDPSTETYWSM